MKIKELNAKKRELEKEIRALKLGGHIVRCGRVRIDVSSYPPPAEPEWGLYILRKELDDTKGKKENWVTVIKSKTREAAIAAIPDLVDDLQRLSDYVGREMEEQ